MKLTLLNHCFLLSLVSICFASGVDAQAKKKRPSDKRAATKIEGLFNSQDSYLTSLILLADEADNAYSLYSTGDALIAAHLSLEKKAFQDYVIKMRQLNAPRCSMTLPRSLDLQTSRMLDAYVNMGDFIDFLENGLRGSTYLQFSQKKKSLIAKSGLSTLLTDVEVLEAQHRIARLAKSKLRNMLGLYPIQLRPDPTDAYQGC